MILENRSSIAILGSGQMGRGIGHVCAVAGYDVLLIDKERAVLEKALASIENNIRRRSVKGEIDEAMVEESLARISVSDSLASVQDRNLVIEAVSEDEKIKTEVYQAIAPYLSSDAILSSNTSSISITRLASLSGIPDRFVGIHFMNPVPVMGLIELIRGLQTSDDTFQEALSFAKSLDKETTEAGDFPAFIVNRVLLPMINEAIYILYEGVGTVESIDKSMKLGANHPMGPLQLADFIGLDTCLSIMQVLYEGLSDPKYRPCPLLVRYCEAGWLGKKTGRGFYDYGGKVPVPTR